MEENVGSRLLKIKWSDRISNDNVLGKIKIKKKQ